LPDLGKLALDLLGALQRNALGDGVAFGHGFPWQSLPLQSSCIRPAFC
jgi:hypothetical protein